MSDEKSAEQPDSSELPKGKNELTDTQASAPEPDEVNKLQERFDRVYNSTNKLKRNGLLSLFAMTLLVSLVLGTVTPLKSQPISPSTQVSPSASQDCSVPADLCEQIKQQAKTDVEAEEKKRTEYVIKRFTPLHPDWKTNLSAPEIAKIELAIAATYEQEYNKEDEIKKHDPQAALKKFFENGPWVYILVASLGFLAARFWEAIGKGWTALVKAIYDWVYGRFAGTPLFESVALRRYREALVENYQDLKIPFRVNQKPLKMKDIYVPLKVAGSSDSDQVDAYGAIAQHRRLMITGIPGSGKTMLLSQMAFSYGKGCLTGLENRPVPVLMELKRLRDPDLTEEKLIAAIVETFRRNRFPDAGRFVRHSLQHGKLMLLLDGLDEVNSLVRPVLVQRISDLLRSLDEHKRCRLIVTCRTAVYKNEFANETEKTLEVVEFTDQQMRQFLDAWQREIPAGKSIDQLMQTLRDRPRIMALARNPLLLTIITHLYTDPSFELPRSRTEFYQKSTSILLDQWQDKFNRYQGVDKRRVLQCLALNQQQASTQQQQDRRSIDYPVVLEQIRQLLPSLNLDPEGDTKPLLEELVERSGLFLKIDGGDRYQFAHLTLQEYFAAVALADKPNELIQFFQQDPTNWREVVKLWCGIGGDSTALIMDVYKQDAILGFECLADAQEVDQQKAESIIDHFKRLLGNTDTGEQDDIAKAFGAVAASDCPRGQAVFQFLQAALNQPNEIHRYGAIVQALSFTNRPQAAKVLATRYTEIREIVRQPLVRMGDLAVPELALLATQGHQSAIDDLYTIGTTDALNALVPMLWEPRQTASTAAWYLASLLLQPGVEEGLNNYPLLILEAKIPEKNSMSFSWVWEPFQEKTSSAMTTIIGKIAQAIAFELNNDERTHVNFPQTSLDLDPRIAIPLFAILNVRDFYPAPTWNLEQVETLLEQRDYTDQLNQQALNIVNSFFIESSDKSVQQFLLNRLPPMLQLDLLRSLVIADRLPKPDDWLNIFKPVQYEFKTSWHYRGILLIAAMFSILAVISILHTASVQSIGAVTGVMGFAVVIIGVFWWALAKGVEEPWEPNLFIKLGSLGLQTYGIELRQLFQCHRDWSGIEVIFKLFSTNVSLIFAFAGAFAVVVDDALAVAFAGTSTFVRAVFFAGTFACTGAVFGAGSLAVTVAAVVAFVAAVPGAGSLAVAIAVAGSVAGAVIIALAFAAAGDGAIAIAVAGTVAGAITLSFSGARAGAIAGFALGALAGLGIGSWYHFKAEPKKQGLKFFAVLALPWFCTAPIVLIFAGIGLDFLLTPIAFLPLQPWQSAGLLELFLVGVSSWLWRWGQKREAMARNPLQGGLIETTLRTKYGRPKT
jgi:NACHT domain